MKTIDRHSGETEIHRGRAHRVIRVRDPAAGPLIVKRGLDDGDLGSFRSALQNEQRILERLQGLDGCPRLIRYDPAVPELAVADFGGVTLGESGLLGRLELATFLTLAEKLAHCLAEIHGRGVIHTDLNPANLLVRSDDLRVQVIGFDLSTTVAEEHPGFDHLSGLPGTPAYLSPEQTGRMNRPVDYRTDLYALGAILYTLATGRPPFAETDPLALVHAHLARAPLPPGEHAPWLPPLVTELILTLLAKEPDDRYQSAAGLAHDLHRLRIATAAQQPLAAVRLKERDLPLAPRPPRRLYGRESELAMLLTAFTGAIEGVARGLFVAGYSGVGKTVLIHEIHRPVTLARGLFISGKFEQFRHDRPFLGPVQALRQLCQLLLAEPEAQVAEWRARILAGVGPDAGALLEVVPELQSLLGPQAPVPALGPHEAQVRLRTLLVALVRQVAAPAHPLVLFLDDLQWADQPSLDFIGALLEEPDLVGMLLIGAFRDNEVDQAHPLLRLLGRPTVTGAAAPVLTLVSLTAADMTELLADMLHLSHDAVRPLAAALYAKTSGNPFFTIEFLNALYREGALRPDPDQGRWKWDTAAIQARPASANVVDFLAAGLRDLARQTAESLVAAACLGTTCTLGQLALATGEDLGALAERLRPALERGILVTPKALAVHQADGGAALTFCHDRMQQAVYLLRDDAWRARLHLAMARRFARSTADPVHPLRAAEHYAIAAPLIVETAERVLARGLFLKAAIQARQSGAFVTAERFLRLGIGQLAADAWHSDHDAAFILHTELHLVLYSQSRNREADAVYALLAAQTTSPRQLIAPICIQIASLSNRTRYADAVRLGGDLLAQLGIRLPPEPVRESLDQELALFYRHVAAGALDRLPMQPDMDDERLLNIALLLNRLIPAALFSGSLLGFWMMARCSRLWIEAGYCEFLSYPMCCITMVTIAMREDYATGYRAARAALETALTRDPGGLEVARAQHSFGLFACHWFQPLGDDLGHAQAAFTGLLRSGDLEFANFTFFTSLGALFDTCTQLPQMSAEIATAIGFTRKTGSTHSEQAFLPYRQLVRALEGKTLGSGSLADAEFDDAAHLAAIQGNAMALAYFHTYRALGAGLFNDEAGLVSHAESAVLLSRHISGFYPTALANLLHSLALIAQLPATAPAARPALLERLAGNQAWLAARAADAPMNFAHLYDLVEALRLDALDQPWAALQVFEQAMRGAQAHQRPWHHAFITERAGHCAMRQGLEHAGRALLLRAHDLYRHWGAAGKVLAMRAALPFIDAGVQGRRGARPVDPLDYEALLRASQALAAETSQPRLRARVVDLMGQLTGATDVQLLVRNGEDDWLLEGGLRGSERLTQLTRQAAEAQRIIAGSVLRLGLKTLAPLVSDDAVIDSRFTGDPHFAGLALCALLALPVVVQGRITAFLVLENRLFRAAFTAARIEALSLLCGQFAISLENARLYQSLEHKVAERTRELSEANALLSEAIRRSEAEVAERRRAEEALRESEAKVRDKLAAILLPEGDIGTLELADILDTAAIQAIMDDFFQLTGIGVALIDRRGTVLVATGWQDICTRYHRVHPETLRNCIESDTQLSLGGAPGTFKAYNCKNQLWDIATPIVVGGKRLGHLFLGQFFYDDEVPDYDCFRRQARQFGFNEADYLAALDRVPRWSRDTIDRVMRFYSRFSTLISTLSYSNLKLARALDERKRAEEALRESEDKFKAIANYAASWEAWFSPEGRLLWMNPFSVEITGFTPEEYLAADDFLAMLTVEEDRPRVLKKFQEAFQGSRGDGLEFRGVRKDGSIFWVSVSWRPILDADGRSLGFRTSAQDITANRQAREDLDRARAAAEAANHQLAVLSTTDSLTGLANRRRFDDTLHAEWQRGARSGESLGLAMLDVDWFKNYNDRYGHQAGDECLRALAGVLGAQAHRISDLAARYGGEEFAVIAPATDAAGMLRLGESIRTALEALALPHADSPFGRITVSIGVATGVPVAGTPPDALLRLADAALYRAKGQGRNRTVQGAPGAAISHESEIC